MDDKYGTLVGLREMLRLAAAKNAQGQKFDVEGSSGTAHMAAGGMVPPPVDISDIPEAVPQMRPFEDTSAIPPAAPPMPADQAAAPSLKDITTSLNQTPDTDYNFYKSLSADDRAALQQKLMAQQRSAPNLIAQGLAGVGDAIANSYGGKNTTFQKDVMANNEAQQQKQLSAFDTQRSQKMQDMNANLEMQANDPSSPLSLSMQKIVKSQGINVPSKMPASMMLKVLGPLGELAMKQATLEQTKLFQAGTLANQEEARKIEATKALGSQGIVQRFMHPEVTSQLEKESGMASGRTAPAASPMAFKDAGKEAKYQAWKAAQGK